MKAKELIGKLAIRTGETESGDHSYVDSPLKILKVTEHHIITSHERTPDEGIFGDKIHILCSRWLDDKWIDYKDLISGCEKSKLRKGLEKVIKK